MGFLKGTIRHQCLHCSRFFWDDCPYTEFCSRDCGDACDPHDAAMRRIERSMTRLAKVRKGNIAPFEQVESPQR